MGLSTPHAVTTDKGGNIFATGDFLGTVDFDPGNDTFALDAGNVDNLDMAAFIFHLDPQGNFNWAKALGGNGAYAKGESIAVDPSGAVYTSGAFLCNCDFDPGDDTFNRASASPDIWDIYVHKLACARDTGGYARGIDRLPWLCY